MGFGTAALLVSSGVSRAVAAFAVLTRLTVLASTGILAGGRFAAARKIRTLSFGMSGKLGGLLARAFVILGSGTTRFRAAFQLQNSHASDTAFAFALFAGGRFARAACACIVAIAQRVLLFIAQQGEVKIDTDAFALGLSVFVTGALNFAGAFRVFVCSVFRTARRVASAAGACRALCRF